MAKGIPQADPTWRAALLRAVAHGFHYPSAGHAVRVLAALDSLAGRAPVRPHSSLARALHQARNRWRHVGGEALEAEYSRLFLNQVPCPMHETAYSGPGGVAGRTHEIADIAGFYLAFGLRLADGEADRPDHLCAELEFMSMLPLKWAHADARGWGEKRRITARAARAFLTDHLGRWHRAFAGRLDASGAATAYRALGTLLTQTVDAECLTWGARPARANGEVMRDSMQEDNLACPRAAADMPASHPDGNVPACAMTKT